ncbi:gamete antigen 27/25 (G27/25) [Plasmodium malariae]|uniref:Gamete antigen 27/25 (G27/25) n=1 Tax=Plasmodium malariae TaxID=5858 RepID=A0A1A8X9B3_PLAMA|nr:gamete antigen 27/25 (G27/25) [Plasmodium malariae]
MKEAEKKGLNLKTENALPYAYTYDHLKNGGVKEEVKKLGDVEFHASNDILYKLLPNGADKAKLFLEIEKTEKILEILNEYEGKYGYKFVDDESKNNCVSRIKRRLNLIVMENILTEEYCKQAQKYFWVEQRLDEEMSAKVDKLKTEEEKKKMCHNAAEIKKLLGSIEKGRSVKLSEKMVDGVVSSVENFLLDVLRTSKIVVPSKVLPVAPEDPSHKKSEKPSHFEPLDPIYFNPEDPSHKKSEKPSHFEPLDPIYFNPEDPSHKKSEKPSHFEPLDPIYFNPEDSSHKKPEVKEKENSTTEDKN